MTLAGTRPPTLDEWNKYELHHRARLALFAVVVPAAAFPVKFILKIFLINYIDANSVIFFLFSAQIFYTIIRSIYVNLYKVQRKQKKYVMKLRIIVEEFL